MPTAADKRNVIPQVAFNAGEVTAYLRGRIDLQKFQQGAAEITNFIVLPQGPITRRGGTVWQSSLDYVSGDEGDLPPELQIIPWDYITTPDGAACPLIFDYLNVPSDKVCIFNTSNVWHAPLGMSADHMDGISFVVMFWCQIDSLGPLFTYNTTTEIAGADWWVGTRLFHDGFDWRLTTIFDDSTDETLPNGYATTTDKQTTTVAQLPAVPDNDCYHIAIKWTWNPNSFPAPPAGQVTLYVNGTSVATNSGFITGMTRWEEWRTPAEAEGQYCWFTRTEKGTDACAGKLAQVMFFANGKTAVASQPISAAGIAAIYNGGTGLSRADMDTTADPTLGGNVSDNLVFYADLSDESNEPKYYSNESSPNDYLELVDFIDDGLNPEDTSIASAW